MNVTGVKDEHCPQCGVLFVFDTFCFRKMTEFCGHVMCRHCVITSIDGCMQCKYQQSKSNLTSSNYPIEKELIPLNNDEDMTKSTCLNYKVKEFVRVELTETPTKFMISIPSEPDVVRVISGSGKEPIFIHNPNTFCFTSAKDPTCNSNQRNNDMSTSVIQNMDTSNPEDGTSDVTPRTTRKDDNGNGIPYFITVLQDNPPIYECNFCADKFTIKLCILNHTFCAAGMKPYRCHFKDCGKQFSQKSHYKYHLRIHAASGHKPFLCSCGEAFSRKRTLAAHRSSQNHPKLRDGDSNQEADCVTCCYCDIRFPFMNDLKMHLMRHLDDFQIKCTICGIAFKHKHILSEHIMIAHNRNTQPGRVAIDAGAGLAGVDNILDELKDLVPSKNIPTNSKKNSDVITTTTATKTSGSTPSKEVVTVKCVRKEKEATAIGPHKAALSIFPSDFISQSFLSSGLPPNSSFFKPTSMPSEAKRKLRS